MKYMNDLKRFFSYVELPNNKLDECWFWLGAVRNGYGEFEFMGSAVLAHRFSWVILMGDISTGLELDHVCEVRLCVNPYHLEPVTHKENIQRSAETTLFLRCVQELNGAASNE